MTGSGLAIASAGDDSSPTIQITSPLGRSGLPGKVRIVARVTLPPRAEPPTVNFYVDDKLLSTDTDGPPYAVEWDDDNPFEIRRLAVEMDGGEVGTVRDEITLQPFEFVEVSQVLSIGLEASVQDAKGRYVSGLDKSGFLVLEDGVQQTVENLTSDDLPATYALLIDSSQSMSRNIDFVRDAASRFAGHLREMDTAIVAPFRDGITTTTGPTRDAATISDAVSAIRPKGTTAIFDALDQVTQRFAAGEGRRVVVLVTDGYDERSQELPDDVLERVKISGVTVYVVSIGGVAGVSMQGERTLRRIASETGGRAFFPWDRKQLREAHAAIADDVQHRYWMSYTPVNQRQDGTWRKITVQTADPEHRIRSRAGYRAPMPPPVRASIEFTATDERRQYVTLTRDDIDVIEDGVLQEVDVFNEAVAPVSIMLALDASGSMKRASESVQDAARAFVTALRPDDPLGMVLFADKAERAHDLSTRRELALEAIQEYRANGGTALYDALSEGIDRLRTVDGRRVVVVVTDGRDEDAKSTGPGSTHTWAQVIASAREVGATVYAIGLGTKVDRERLEELATLTGGEAYFTSDAAELDAHYRRVVEELHRRYVVAYTSTNSNRDGSWRGVQIAVKTNPQLHIRSRGGYNAPTQ